MQTDYMELRAAILPHRQRIDGRVEVKTLDLAELLAAYDALVAAGTKAKKAAGYSAEFEEAWTEYPTRPGNSKAAAYKAWSARLKAGATVLEMIEGTRKYAIYCKAEGTEPQYVKQAATFYGPGEHFAADWTPRAAVRRLLPDRREQKKADTNAEALARLAGIPVFDPNVIDMEGNQNA
ncbi:MAG: hypothetical protein V4641_16255 [Pseudomonadota bacterium]